MLLKWNHQRNSLDTKSSNLLRKIPGTLCRLHAVEVDISAMEEHMPKSHPYTKRKKKKLFISRIHQELCKMHKFCSHEGSIMAICLISVQATVDGYLVKVV